MNQNQQTKKKLTTNANSYLRKNTTKTQTPTYCLDIIIIYYHIYGVIPYGNAIHNYGTVGFPNFPAIY